MMGVPVLEARNLVRILPGDVPTTLIDGISLRVNPGEFVAITGPSGGGKSSLLYLLGLLDSPTAGDVLISGEVTTALSSDAKAALRLSSVGFVFQFHFLLEEFSARDNILLPMRQLGRLDARTMRQRAEGLLERFGLETHAGKFPHQLSGGQRQRVAIARALANAPRLVLADEPTGNLDTRNADAVFAAFRDIVETEQSSVVVVTHDLDLASRADRRIHIVDGKIVPV
jgi:lipoprotein-releasing system ATP-binding protein